MKDVWTSEEAASPFLRSLEQIPSATEASLRRVLITTDGAGHEVKRAALEELLRRKAAKDGETRDQ